LLIKRDSSATSTYLDCSNNYLTALDLTGLNTFIYFEGSTQTASLTLAYAGGGNYSGNITLNNHTGLATGVSYSSGTLTSTSNSITSTPFTVSTNNGINTLSGTLNYPAMTKETTPNAAIDFTGETLTGLSGSYTINANAVTITGDYPIDSVLVWHHNRYNQKRQRHNDYRKRPAKSHYSCAYRCTRSRQNRLHHFAKQ